MATGKNRRFGSYRGCRGEEDNPQDLNMGAPELNLPGIGWGENAGYQPPDKSWDKGWGKKGGKQFRWSFSKGKGKSKNGVAGSSRPSGFCVHDGQIAYWFCSVCGGYFCQHGIKSVGGVEMWDLCPRREPWNDTWQSGKGSKSLRRPSKGKPY